MKIIIESHGRNVAIEGYDDDITIRQIFGLFIVPALLGAGWSIDVIEKIFKDGDPTKWEDIYED